MRSSESKAEKKGAHTVAIGQRQLLYLGLRHFLCGTASKVESSEKSASSFDHLLALVPNLRSFSNTKQFGHKQAFDKLILTDTIISNNHVILA